MYNIYYISILSKNFLSFQPRKWSAFFTFYPYSYSYTLYTFILNTKYYKVFFMFIFFPMKNNTGNCFTLFVYLKIKWKFIYLEKADDFKLITMYRVGNLYIYFKLNFFSFLFLLPINENKIRIERFSLLIFLHGIILILLLTTLLEKN